jgi:hypothetical protein
MGEKPISERMVGRKTGREEKDTLQEKYIRAVNQFCCAGC